MRPRPLAAVLLVLSLPFAALSVAGCAQIQPTPDAEKAAEVVASAQNTLVKMKSSHDKPMDEFRALLPKAEGVVILPGVIKGGFIVGAEGGNGVLLAKDASGQWSSPAFYFLAAGSVGLQIGGQATDVVLLVFNQGAVESIIKHQGKLGADMGLVVGTIGAGVEASTTTNIGADIMAFSQGIGAFAGGSLEAAALVKRNDLNEAYYGAGATPEGIVQQGAFHNPGADGLRGALQAP